MGFKKGMFAMFALVDEDGSGFLEVDEIQSKFYLIFY